MAARNSLTQHLRVLEKQCAPALVPERFEFADGRYTVRVANDLESRRKAYQLVYKLYLEKEYAKPNPSRMWLSIFDALPETTTLLVERQEPVVGCRLPVVGGTENRKPTTENRQPVGALTVVFDSPMGLPADKLYQGELDALRSSGRRVAEVTSLGVAEEAGAGAQILVKLFNFAYFIARGVRASTDFVVTVNPRHVRFYERLMLFAEAGPERSYDKVGGAPAVLLRLDLDVPEERVRLERGPAEARPAGSRTLYAMFQAAAQAPEIIAGLAASLRPMTGPELGYFFVAETDVLKEAAPEQRALVQEAYLTCEAGSPWS